MDQFPSFLFHLVLTQTFMFTRKFYSNSCRHTNIDTKIIFMVHMYIHIYIQVCACIIPMHVLQNTLIQSVYSLKTDTSGIQAKKLAMDYKTLPERTIYIYTYIYISHIGNPVILFSFQTINEKQFVCMCISMQRCICVYGYVCYVYMVYNGNIDRN